MPPAIWQSFLGVTGFLAVIQGFALVVGQHDELARFFERYPIPSGIIYIVTVAIRAIVIHAEIQDQKRIYNKELSGASLRNR